MRQDLYDNTRGSVPAPPAAPEPYGAVPPALPPLAAGGGRGGRRNRRGSVRGNVARCLLLLSLILLLTAAGLLLRGGVFTPRLPRIESGWDQRDYYFDDWEDYEDDDWLADLENTNLRRAPVGGGVTLDLTPSGGVELTAQEIYERVSPAVVGVRAACGDELALGTGVILSADGYIITNAHVIAGSCRVEVALSDDSRQEALLVGYDGGTDLAVLKIDAQGLPCAQFGDSAELRVGDPAYAIGNPLGEELRGTMTDGIISAIDRTVDMDGQEMTLIQTTAALNSGNSGGALVNAAGQVVGITNMKMMSDWETIEGLGFAIPTALAKEVVDQIIAQGSFDGFPALGITVRNCVPDLDGQDRGILVLDVIRSGLPGSAWRQGLREGDIIRQANGQAVEDVDDLIAVKAGLSAGDTVTLTYWRDGRFQEAVVELIPSGRLEER